MDANTKQTNKSHRVQKTGAGGKNKKRDKREKKKNGGVSTKGNKGNNPKAFAMQSGLRANRMAQRRIEKNERKLHLPLVDRTPEVPPPIVVAVVGPPKTGKTTLIKSLVRRYTKHTISENKGPITVVSGKKQRITFMEGVNDINGLVDLAKVADLVLLTIDASFGFEMETFEFLNILQAHGFPRVMGVLTFLDRMKDNKALSAKKKQMKHRFWTEIYDGAKLFYLSGVINGRYPDREILNLSRYISVMKFRPLVFHNSRSYVVADRIEDLTSREVIKHDYKSSRKVTVYGYLRGTNMRERAKVHIPGVGDFTVKSIEELPDPCPMPDSTGSTTEGTTGVKRRKRLDEKAKKIYAPMSDIGGLIYDKDAVYINVPGNFSYGNQQQQQQQQQQKRRLMNGEGEGQGEGDGDDEEIAFGEGEQMILKLQHQRETVAEKLAKTDMVLFGGDEENQRQEVRVGVEELEEMEQERVRRRAFSDDDDDDANEGDSDSDEDEDDSDDYEDDDEDDEEDEDEDEDEDQASHIKYKFKRLGKKRQVNLMDLVYNNNPRKNINNIKKDDEEEDEEDMEMEMSMQVTKKFNNAKDMIYQKFQQEKEEIENIDYEKLMARFTGVKNKVKKAGNSDDDENDDDDDDDEDDDEDEGSDEDSDVYGDFEDLETTQNGEQEDEDEEEEEDDEEEDDEEEEQIEQENKKILLKKMFDQAYDNKELGDNNDDSENENGNKKTQKGLNKYKGKGRGRGRGKREEEGDDDDEEEGEKKDLATIEKEKLEAQKQKNIREFEGESEIVRRAVEGVRAGKYVRIEFAEGIPYEFVEHFDGRYPIIVGTLLASEQSENFGMVQTRLKKHRWYHASKVLKTNDPLVFSVGWRRFQSVVTYAIGTNNKTMVETRMLKYTPEHMHCLAVFYGPIVPPNTAFICLPSAAKVIKGFRICATGVVLETNKNIVIKKKLKLTGVPHKILKTTAYVKNMFNSPLEVAKFEGAKLQTVSGIRGVVKKAASSPMPPGCFRATFEDKILMSDIVFLKSWYTIDPVSFYYPVTNLLFANKPTSWQGLKPAVQIRRELGLKLHINQNSLYKDKDSIRPVARKFNPLRIPKALVADLPFKSKPKLIKSKSTSKSSGSTSKINNFTNKIAKISNSKLDSKISSLMIQINTINNIKSINANLKRKQKLEQNQKKLDSNNKNNSNSSHKRRRL